MGITNETIIPKSLCKATPHGLTSTEKLRKLECSEVFHNEQLKVVSNLGRHFPTKFYRFSDKHYKEAEILG